MKLLILYVPDTCLNIVMPHITQNISGFTSVPCSGWWKGVQEQVHRIEVVASEYPQTEHTKNVFSYVAQLMKGAGEGVCCGQNRI